MFGYVLATVPTPPRPHWYVGHNRIGWTLLGQHVVGHVQGARYGVGGQPMVTLYQTSACTIPLYRRWGASTLVVSYIANNGDSTLISPHLLHFHIEVSALVIETTQVGECLQMLSGQLSVGLDVF